MENTVSTFVLIIATLLIGVIAVGIAAVYASNQYNVSTIQNQAESISNGLYISVGKMVNIPNSPNSTVFITLKDFNYQGQLYFTSFYVKNYLENSSSEITPQFAYMKGSNILYPEVQVGNQFPPSITSSTLYYTNLNVLYQGTITLWETTPLSAPVDIALTISPPPSYSAIVLFFAHIQNKYVEVGYVWL